MRMTVPGKKRFVKTAENRKNAEKIEKKQH